MKYQVSFRAKTSLMYLHVEIVVVDESWELRIWMNLIFVGFTSEPQLMWCMHLPKPLSFRKELLKILLCSIRVKLIFLVRRANN